MDHGHPRRCDEGLARLAAPAPELLVSLNANVGGNHQTFVQPGALLRGAVNVGADCVWAEIEQGVLPAMDRGRRSTVDQVHGHASPWSWERNG